MMEKRFCGIISLAAGLLMVAGCAADSGDGDGGEVPIYLTAIITEGSGVAVTRAGVDLQTTQLPADATFRAEFSGSDVSVENTTYQTNGSGGTVCTGTQPYFKLGCSSTTVKAFYPSTVTSTTTTFTVATDQSQTETGEANYLASDLLYASANISKVFPVTTAALQFTHRMSKIVVNITMGTGITAISSVKIVGGYPTANLTAGTAEPTGTATGTAFSSTPLVMFDGTSEAYITPGTPLQCAALIPPQTINGSFLQVVTNGGTSTFSLASSKVFAAGQRYLYNVDLTMATIGANTTITDWTSGGGTQIINNNGGTMTERSNTAPAGAEAVDLGLSVKWANMNIGATSETDYGSYFQWGDPTDKSAATCSWATYKWNPSGDGTTMTKYNDTDGKTVLDLTDDMAYMNWGGKWRMPTYAEFVELLTLDKEWVADYHGTGVSGYTFTGNGNTIFLPASGCRGATLNNGGQYGYYCSSTLNTSRRDCGRYFYFGSDQTIMGNNNRCLGLSVRAVMDK